VKIRLRIAAIEKRRAAVAVAKPRADRLRLVFWFLVGLNGPSFEFQRLTKRKPPEFAGGFQIGGFRARKPVSIRSGGVARRQAAAAFRRRCFGKPTDWAAVVSVTVVGCDGALHRSVGFGFRQCRSDPRTPVRDLQVNISAGTCVGGLVGLSTSLRFVDCRSGFISGFRLQVGRHPDYRLVVAGENDRVPRVTPSRSERRAVEFGVIFESG